MIKFEISDENQQKINDWLKNTVYPAVIEEQKEAFKKDEVHGPHLTAISFPHWDQGYPYQGAIAGGLTYHFTPTSIGEVQKVSYGKHELDLTDYESW